MDIVQIAWKEIIAENFPKEEEQTIDKPWLIFDNQEDNDEVMI